jgi:hypothetical protein
MLHSQTHPPPFFSYPLSCILSYCFLSHTVSVLGSVLQLLVTAKVPSLLLASTLMMEAIRSSETPLLIKAIWYHIPEDGILHTHWPENLKCNNRLIA